MGVVCPCGVIVQGPANGFAVSENNNVKFDGQQGTIRGDIFYRANICATKLDSSTLTLRFEDTETPDANNFTFNANSISCVECNPEGQNCSIRVIGTGIVNNTVYDFEAVFRDQVEQANVDIVQMFEITDFFNQTGAAPIDQGSIVQQGCQETECD